MSQVDVLLRHPVPQAAGRPFARLPLALWRLPKPQFLVLSCRVSGDAERRGPYIGDVMALEMKEAPAKSGALECYQSMGLYPCNGKYCYDVICHGNNKRTE